MKFSPVAGLIVLLCCGLLPLALLGGMGVFTGVLSSAPFLTLLAFLLILVALVVSLRVQKTRAARRKAWAVALGIPVVAIVAGLALVAARNQIRAPALQVPFPEEVSVRVGSLAPDFRLADTFGRSVTRASLVTDRPGLMFFTTTYCLPCIEGLRALKRFQDDIGADRFRVLIVFVDPRESNRDLQAYQARNQFPQAWHYALDADRLLEKYRVRALDTKFVLDPEGIVRFVDIYPARYETWEQALATVEVFR